MITAYGKAYGVLNVLVPQHYVWMSKNNWVENLSNRCYQIFNGMWVYEYINYFERAGVKDPKKLPGHYPKDVPDHQKQYLRH